MINALKAIFYKDSITGKEPFLDWLDGLKDALEEKKMIFLLIGGDKSTQSKDITKAKKFWALHKKEKKNG